MNKWIMAIALAISCSTPMEMGANKIKIDTEVTECNGIVEQDSTRLYVEKTKATFYHDKFHGRLTANGTVFSQKKLTVAHNKLPFGTVLKVTNLKNNKSVIVVVNDRGKLGNNVTLDLSKEAFKQISKTERGVINVKVEILTENTL